VERLCLYAVVISIIGTVFVVLEELWYIPVGHVFFCNVTGKSLRFIRWVRWSKNPCCARSHKLLWL